MKKRALMVGISTYDEAPDLACSVDDAKAMEKVISRHGDGSVNYQCKTLCSDSSRVDESDLRGKVKELFADMEGGDVIFYFSGHGVISDTGGYLVTQDGTMNDEGYPMSELLQRANQAGVGSVSLILDCCHSGGIGDNSAGSNQITLTEGVTVLAASSGQQESHEGVEYSMFTELLLDALEGGAADIRGRISAASIYGYVEQVLDDWEQRPMYKSHASKLNPVRLCQPAVTDEALRELKIVFSNPGQKVDLDRSFEHSFPEADDDNIAVFNLFKQWRNARLLQTCNGEDLYYAAKNKGSVELTRLGQFYWDQVAKNLI